MIPGEIVQAKIAVRRRRKRGPNINRIDAIQEENQRLLDSLSGRVEELKSLSEKGK